MIIDISTIKAGFCDRLRRVTFCMAVASVRGDRVLYIKDGDNEFCPYRFRDLVEVDGFEVREWRADCGEMEAGIYRSYSGPAIQVVRALKPPDLRLPDSEFLALWIRCYQMLRPTSPVEKRLPTLNGVDCIGLHVRLTDKVASRPDPSQIGRHEIKTFEAKALRYINRLMTRHSRPVFLACDNQASRDEWRGQLTVRGIEVISSGAVYHDDRLRQTSGEDFAVDLFGLSRCSVIIGLVRSGVVQTAARIGRCQRTIIIKDQSPLVMFQWLCRKGKSMWQSMRPIQKGTLR